MESLKERLMCGRPKREEKRDENGRKKVKEGKIGEEGG